MQTRSPLLAPPLSLATQPPPSALARWSSSYADFLPRRSCCALERRARGEPISLTLSARLLRGSVHACSLFSSPLVVVVCAAAMSSSVTFESVWEEFLVSGHTNNRGRQAGTEHAAHRRRRVALSLVQNKVRPYSALQKKHILQETVST